MDLEDTMASLQLTDRIFDHVHTSETLVEEAEEEEEDEELASESTQLRRSARLRSRIRPLSPEKRRVLMKPVKIPKDSNLGNIENYYLDKRVKRLHPTLETIYEESHRNQETCMSSKKFQRRINFSAATSKNNVKVKKRKMKAKHVTANKRVIKKKLSLKYVMDKLAKIKEDD